MCIGGKLLKILTTTMWLPIDKRVVTAMSISSLFCYKSVYMYEIPLFFSPSLIPLGNIRCTNFKKLALVLHHSICVIGYQGED